MFFNRIKNQGGAIGVLALLFISPSLQAGGFTIIEMGAKKTGMMTGIAKPDDLSAVYHNPAGLADLHGTRLHLSSGFSFVDASIRLRAWPGGEGTYGSEDFIDTPVDEDGYFRGTVHPTRYFGVMPMLVASSDFGWEKGPVTAFSVYVPDFIGAFLPQDAPTRYMVVEGYLTAGVASFSTGYRLPEPVEWLAVGASAGLLYIRMEGKRWDNFQTLGEYNLDLITRMVGEDYRFFWNAGICARLLPQLTLGLSFIGGAEVEMEGRLDISLAPGWEEDAIAKALVDQGVIQPENRYRMRNLMKVPYGVNTGLNWAIIPELELAVDFRYWFYQFFKDQKIYHNIDIKIFEKPVEPNPIVIPKDYEGSWTISVGVLGRPFEFPLELLGGWTYDHSPAPSHAKSLDSPTVNLTGFALGARYTLDATWRISLTYYRYWYLRDEVNDSILDPPQNVRFSGSVNTVSIQLEVTL